jgi:hypothetical protein
MRPRPRMASRLLDTLRYFDGKSGSAGVVNSPYRSDSLVLLRFFRRGGQTGGSGSSSPLALFLPASRWIYAMELRCKVGLSGWMIRDTDLLSLLNPCPLHRVVAKNSVVYVTVFDSDILQGLRNFCRRHRHCIVFIHQVSVQSLEPDQSQAYLHPTRTSRIR